MTSARRLSARRPPVHVDFASKRERESVRSFETIIGRRFALQRQLVDHNALPGGQTALDDEIGAVDEAGVVRAEIGDGRCDVVRPPDPSDWVPAGKFLENLRVL